MWTCTSLPIHTCFITSHSAAADDLNYRSLISSDSRSVDVRDKNLEVIRFVCSICEMKYTIPPCSHSKSRDAVLHMDPEF
jgi:hypothetical protein